MCVLTLLAWHGAKAQEVDTTVAVGGDQLHFHILKGTGMPILFEAGGGDDASVWADLLKPVQQITHAPLITYDRAGFGQSKLDGGNPDVGAHGIQKGVDHLEAALKQLGYEGDVMLVAHSYGALYATLYAVRHPARVKAAVFIDGSSACWFTKDWMKDFVRKQGGDDKPDEQHLGSYYQTRNLPVTVDTVRANPFPVSIPVIDLVSEHPPFSDEADIDRWQKCHQQFVGASRNREGITVAGSGHYIYRDNPELVVKVIAKAYAGAVDNQTALQVLRRELDRSIEEANKADSRRDSIK